MFVLDSVLRRTEEDNAQAKKIREEQPFNVQDQTCMAKVFRIVDENTYDLSTIRSFPDN